MAPARNEPCPCGSGKKYKKCCAGLDVMIKEGRDNLPPSTPARVLTDFEEDIITEMYETVMEIVRLPDPDFPSHMVPSLVGKKQERSFRRMLHCQMTHPIPNEPLYWARNVELARVYTRFTDSFNLRCEDEYYASGELIGALADPDREYPHVAGDYDSRLMREFKKYLKKAHSKGALPKMWQSINDQAASFIYCNSEYRSPLGETFSKYNSYPPDELEILRRLAADVLGDRVETGCGGNWFHVADTDESEWETESETESETKSETERDESEGRDSLLWAKFCAASQAMTRTKLFGERKCGWCAAGKRTDGTGGKRSCFECKCKFGRYCSKACQNADWPHHKAKCRIERHHFD